MLLDNPFFTFIGCGERDLMCWVELRLIRLTADRFVKTQPHVKYQVDANMTKLISGTFTPQNLKTKTRKI